MKHLFMVDLETTGETSSDAILELAFLHLVKDRNFYRPGMFYRRVFHYSFPPESSFAKEHHAELYDECRFADTSTPSEVEHSIRDFFAVCGSTDPEERVMVGSRLPGKLERLDRVRYLLKPQVMDFAEGPRKVGEYQSVIDLHGVGTFIAAIFEEQRQDVHIRLENLKLAADLPNGRRRRALYDCFVYLNRMNEYRMYFNAPWEFLHAGVSGQGSKV